MAIGPILSELWPSITQQQGTTVVQALAATQVGPGVPDGLTNGQKAERCLRQFIKSVVKGKIRADQEAAIIVSAQSQVDTDYPEA